MKRREFLAASCLGGLASLANTACGQGDPSPAGKEYYELRFYRVEAGPKQAALCDFLADAAIPALNRIGIEPVGVFLGLEENLGGLYMLLPHPTLESVARANTRLLSDPEFLAAGAAFLDAPKPDPAYQRIESSLLLAFDHMPRLERPSDKPGRVFQLRRYESHSAKKAKKKIEMFNEGGEIALFRRTGLNPVFFGEALVGSRLPNLTYMLGFGDRPSLEKAWKTFLADPEWDRLKRDPQYKDTVSNITNILLKPAECSQI